MSGTYLRRNKLTSFGIDCTYDIRYIWRSGGDSIRVSKATKTEVLNYIKTVEKTEPPKYDIAKIPLRMWVQVG